GIAFSKVAVHPLDGVCVNIRGDHLYRRWQVDDHWFLRGSFHTVHHGVTHINCEIQLGTSEGFWGVLPAPVGVGVIHSNGLDQLCGIGGQLLNCCLILAEYHATLQLGGGVIKVHDDILCTLASFKGAANQVRTRVNQTLDGDVFWNQVLLNDFTNEVEVGLRCRRETHLNFLVAHLHQQLEHAVLTCRRHRVDQSLIAIAQVNSTP